MIRPLTDEEDLHKLDTTDIEKLRQEFLEQVLELVMNFFQSIFSKREIAY